MHITNSFKHDIPPCVYLFFFANTAKKDFILLLGVSHLLGVMISATIKTKINEKCVVVNCKRKIIFISLTRTDTHTRWAKVIGQLIMLHNAEQYFFFAFVDNKLKHPWKNWAPVVTAVIGVSV